MKSKTSFPRWLLLVWFLSLLALASLTARADALSEWTTHAFPTLTYPPGSCYSRTNTLVPVTNGAPYMWRVVAHSGRFIATGHGPCQQDTVTIALHSVDGVNWIRGTNRYNNRNPPYGWGYNGYFALTKGGDLCVGVGWGGETGVSSNGVSWSGTNFLIIQPGLTTSPNLHAVAYGAGRFVAVGDNFNSQGVRGVVAYSTNGINWRQGFTEPVSNPLKPTNAFIAVAYGNNIFWATTRSYDSTRSEVYFSTNGGILFWPNATGDGERLLCFGNNRFIRVGNSLLVNTNSTNWIAVTRPTAAPFDTLTHAAEMFIATAGRDVASSWDGFDWTVRTNALPRPVSSLTYGNGFLIAVGTSPVVSNPSCADGYCGAGDYFISAPLVHLTPTASASTFWVHGITNRDYDILATNEVMASDWPVVNRFTLTNSPQSWTDPNPPGATGSRRFYRARLVP